MNNTVTVKEAFHVRRNGRKQIESGKPPRKVGSGVPRVAKLMALAIRFDQLLRDGLVRDQAELAKLGHVSSARMSQILALLNLAPDIQEAILFLQRGPGRDRVTERSLRAVVAMVDWGRQRKIWAGMKVDAGIQQSPVVPGISSIPNADTSDSGSCSDSSHGVVAIPYE